MKHYLNIFKNFYGWVLGAAFGHAGYHSPAVEQIKQEWTRFFNEHPGDNQKLFVVCHSRGAIDVKNALLSVDESIRKKVIVLAIAPAAIIPNELCYKSDNYASKADFVYQTDREGMREHIHELKLLDPHPDAPRFDHSFDSPTFTETIQWHIKDYIKNYGGT